MTYLYSRVWTVSLPITILNSPIVMSTGSVKFGTARDISGIILFAIGFFFEAVADQSKYIFKKSNKGFCNVSVWRLSRHPNYFGEILLWFGIWILCLSPSTNGPVTGGGYSAQYASILSPIFTFALLFGLSGLPLQEPQAQKKMYESDQRQEYAEYLARTSILLPLPPSLYRPLPLVLKRTILLDLPFYQYDPEKDTNDRSDREERGTN